MVRAWQGVKHLGLSSFISSLHVYYGAISKDSLFDMKLNYLYHSLFKYLNNPNHACDKVERAFHEHD